MEKMNTSEVLDLSKENIQPLKQGRNAVKLGTALHAQTNSELHQKLLAEREQYELLIRMYEGDDPLKPHYDYVNWIEQSFPKHGPESNLVQILENTLTAFKDDERYKQELRYAELLIKYINTQPNPLEIYQVVYDQGISTMCAPFYKAWADELDNNNDFKAADRIYELGKRVKAQPVEMLEEAHLRFQLSVGRRMLGCQDGSPEVESDNNRQALHKLHKKNIHSARDHVSAPGQVKQTLTSNNNQNAPFKVYQGDDDDESNVCGDGQGKTFPKHKLVHKENTLKAGPWTQHGGKLRNRVQPSACRTPSFQVHQDEDADGGSRHPETPTAPGALKTRKKDNFTCPLAVFEPPDPTKKPMYCKNKVYAGGREFQFEELRAALYNRRYEQQFAAQKVEEPAKVCVKEEVVVNTPLKDNCEEKVPTAINAVEGVAREESPYQQPWQVPVSSLEDIKPATGKDLLTKGDEPLAVKTHDHVKPEPLFENKVQLDTNTSLFHSQSFTVNTKEAMNVVQEMWNSPSPSPAFRRNVRAATYPTSPVALDESGLFKVPLVPPPITPKSIPSFPIYSDEEPGEKPDQPFQVYCDEADSKNTLSENGNAQPIGPNKNNCTEGRKDSGMPFHHPILQLHEGQHAGHPPSSDPATLKLLAFESDSDEDDKKVPKPNIQMTETNVDIPRKSFRAGLLPPTFQEEEQFDDITCNTKAFDFVLPSSTPLVSHLKPGVPHQEKNCINGSYVNENVKKCSTKQELSMIFEASKEIYSSSSGSSGSKTQGSVCTTASSNTQPGPAHNKTYDLEKSIGSLNISGDVDPFSTDLISRLLVHVRFPQVHHSEGLHRFDTDAPVIHNHNTIILGPTKYSVVGELGKGNYARVVKAMRDSKPVALKQQRPACQWEWYIAKELYHRLPPLMMNYYLHLSNGYFYKNASILESEWAQYGTILSVVNKLKIAGKTSDLPLALLFSIQMITIVEYLHRCKIIHGDVKPDNFVLYSLPIPKGGMTSPCLKLIDFGRCIDMTLFPEGTTFTKVVTTDGFQCNEMKEGRQWTYQTDLYGLAGSIYCVLCFDYMKVTKKGSCWQLSQKIARYLKPALWEEIFITLLNVESCERLPDLKSLRESLEKYYQSSEDANLQAIHKLNNILGQK